MPYNTRRKSLSLPSLGIHIPVTHAARAAAAASNKALRRPLSSSSSPSPSPSSSSPSATAAAAATTSSSPSPSSSSSSSTRTSAHLSDSSADTMDSHHSKRLKRSHEAASPPPSSSTPVTSVEPSDAQVAVPKIDLQSINDDIVEASIAQLQSTANRPHLIKELATVLAQSLTSVQQSANPCAIISSRLTTYMKRPCWNALSPCPLSKELETVHPRRTYFFLTTCPRQPLLDSSISEPIRHSPVVTPSVSLTDDSGSDDVDARRRDLSPSPEVDLSSPEFDDMEDDMGMPITPMGSFESYTFRMRHGRDLRRNSPPLETDEREFTQTADVLQKRKLTHDEATMFIPEMFERSFAVEYGYRDDIWFGDRVIPSATLVASPAMRPSTMAGLRKEDEADSWLKFNKLFEWDRSAESIEIDELDCLLDTY
ncbi:hypothetical protein E4U42_004049 [Claviceps africana]|uniref:GDS1 winged helix domain-containing protein n=1 Tax=Claviceps africana TaxID=83212 RepID=A0A8K0J6X2_9HYPO|nr:hypothetical protein E4U42_004049 [Claviceps africana]